MKPLAIKTTKDHASAKQRASPLIKCQKKFQIVKIKQIILKTKIHRIGKDMGFRRGARNLPSKMAAMQRTNAPIVRKQKTPIVKSFEKINKGDKNHRRKT